MRRRSWSAIEGGGDSVGTAVLGAGPAGLSAAYVLALRGRPGVVYEADSAVGGIAKTVHRGRYSFDLGGQVFSTDLAPVQRLWESLLGEELIERPRRARVYCGGRYLAFPPKAREHVATLGLSGSVSQTRRAMQQIIRYAGQRSPFDKMNLRHGHGTTLIDERRYPRLGPGQMWEALCDVIVRAGISTRLNHRCVALQHLDGHIGSVVLRSNGNRLESRVDGVLSSIPLCDLIGCLDPAPPADVLHAAAKLRYRSMRVVALMTDDPEPFPDNWIYVHDSAARATRIQNFGVWSEDMVVHGSTCLGVEFACAPGEETWELDTAAAIELAKQELARLGLVDPDRVFDGETVRVRQAYPIRDRASREAIGEIRDYLARFENLETFGRNGLHFDNTQDHSVWSAMLAAANLLDGSSHDIWELDAGSDGTGSEHDDELPDDDSVAAEAAVR